MRELIEYAKSLGFSCEMSGGGHLCFRRPNTMPVFASQSPSCKHARKKTRGDLKHALIEAEQRQKALGETPTPKE
jgi:hypothetical protein